MSRPGLKDIVARTISDLRARKRRRPFAAVKAAARRAPAVRDFAAAVGSRPLSIIAELKKASPSAGLIRSGYDPAAGARAYARAGAKALSVLTEPRFFKGSLDHLRIARKVSGLPVLRKDFIVDEYQVHEARAYGADAVLLIVAVLGARRLKALMKTVTSLGMTPLVEAHDAAELRIAIAAGAPVIGVNSRNLKNLAMDPGLFPKLLPRIPKDRVVVAESGLKTPADIRAVKRLGADAALVGESLLKQKDLEAAARRLIRAGR